MLQRRGGLAAATGFGQRVPVQNVRRALGVHPQLGAVQGNGVGGGAGGCGAGDVQLGEMLGPDVTVVPVIPGG